MLRSVGAVVVVLALAGASGSLAAHPTREGSHGDLEHRTALVSEQIVRPGFAIDYVGVLWQSAAHGGAIRFRDARRWTAWRPLRSDEIERPGRFASALVSANGAIAYQVRLPRRARAARGVALRTSDTSAALRPLATTGVILRAGWGADEALRFDALGGELWPAAYAPLQTITVHHTATRNDDPEPAATVRAIYRYHAVDQGWGDIGYQFLIDEQGRVYEGRYSGEDGDPAHDGAATTDAPGNLVTAAHVVGWNTGNIGVALLGNLRTRQPTAAARLALEQLLAELSARHGLEPLGTVDYVNPINANAKTVATISGHRDWASTECPGSTFYKELPSVRSNVAALLAPPPTGSAHVADLEATTSTSGKAWSAVVSVSVADASETSVASATVTGAWRSGVTSTCTTDASGACIVRLDRLRSTITNTDFTVTGVSAEGLGYDPVANSDLDGDSTGTTIVIQRP